MMNGVAALEACICDGRKFEHTEKVDRRCQVVAFELRELRKCRSMMFVIPLKQVGGSLDRSGHGAIAGTFVLSKCNTIQEETLARCNMPGEFQCAFGRRIGFPTTIVGRYRFDHAPGGLVFISYLGEINLVKEKSRLFWVHSPNLSQIGGRSGRRAYFRSILDWWPFFSNGAEAKYQPMR